MKAESTSALLFRVFDFCCRHCVMGRWLWAPRLPWSLHTCVTVLRLGQDKHTGLMLLHQLTIAVIWSSG